MAGDDVNIRVTADDAQAQRAFRNLKSSAAGLKGALIPLASAALPLAAAMTATAAKAAGAGVALTAYGVAVAGQVSSLKEAAEAQKKYTDAVTQYGRGSAQAAEAQRAVQAGLAGMPQATQRAAVAIGTLKDEYQDWSDSLAKFTMKPVERGAAVLGQVFPRLTGMAKGASGQLDRLVTVAGGAVASPGFDAFSDRMSVLANESLTRAVTGVIDFSLALSRGEAGGPIQAFMDYANANGPALRETLSNVGDAVTTLVQAAAEAGPGMLTLVNAAAGLVASLPPELVGVLMQTAVGLKAVSVAGAALTAVTTSRAVANVTAFVRAAQFGGVGPAISGVVQRMSMLQKVGGSLGVLGVAALAVNELAKEARGAPPDVDKLTVSLKKLSASGKFTGELKSTFGDMDGFVAKLGKLRSETEALDKAQPILDFSSLGGFADTAVEKIDDLVRGSESLGATKDDFKAFDETFAAMAQNGYADQAAQQFRAFKEAALAGGMSLKDFNAAFPQYRDAVAGLNAEQELAAQSMGVFGQAAQDTQAKLSAQKQAADGLRASILALNETNRSAHDAQTQFEESLDGLTESFKEHGATLDKDTEAGRANREAMSQASQSLDEMIATGLAAGDSMASMQKDSEGLRAEMMRLATEAFDGNKTKAREYVNELLGVPKDITTLIRAEKDEAVAGLRDVQAEIKATPGAKEVKVDTLNAAAIAALEKVGLKTEQLPDGRTRVYTANGQAITSIGAVWAALNNLDGKTAHTYTKHHILYEYAVASGQISGRTSKQMGRAQGGRVRGYAGGGDIQHFPNGGYVDGPGSSKSDSILATFASGAMARVSDTEYVVRAESVKKYGLSFLDALNQGRLKVAALAGGGSVKGLARGARDEIRAATSGATEDRLLKLMSSIAGGHLKMATALKRVSGELGKASDKLKDLKSSASQLASSVKSGLLGEASITKAAGAEDSRVTINTLLSQMTASAANTSQFSGMLKSLKKRGLSKTLLRQIAEAGVEGGGMETAAAILGGGSAELKRLNSLQGQISKSAGAAGKTTADAVYAGTIKAQEKLVKALDRLSDALKAKKKAAGGIGGGLTVVGEDGPELLRLPEGGTVYPAGQSRAMWESMLNEPRRPAPRHAATPTGAGSAAGQPMVIQLQVGTTQLGEVVIDPMRKAISTRGGLRAVFPRDF